MTLSNKKIEDKYNDNISQTDEEKILNENLARKGIKGLSLVTFDHFLSPEEHSLAQAGALGIHRQHLKESVSKTRLTLQGYVGKPTLIAGIITDVKFDKNDNMIAFMLASPHIVENTKITNFDSHIWVFFNKISSHPTASSHFKLALGCMVTLVTSIDVYRTHDKIKYGIDSWIVYRSGISYFLPSTSGSVNQVHLETEDSNIVFPFADITYTPNECRFIRAFKEDYLKGEEELVNYYKQMQNNVHISGKKRMLKLRKTFEDKLDEIDDI